MRAKTDRFWNSDSHQRLYDDKEDPPTSTPHRTWVSVSALHAVVLGVIQVLVELEILSNTPALHVVVEVLALLFGMNAGFWG